MSRSKRDSRRRKADKCKMDNFAKLIKGCRPVKELPPGLDMQAAGAAGDDDSAWFKENPAAQWRLRPGITGELPGDPRWVVSILIAPGARLRMPFGRELDDETVRFMGVVGDFGLTDKGPLWIPNAEGERLLEEGKLVLPPRFVGFQN